MTNLERLLSQYAAYHLDRNNIVTHFVGIPLIVFSILCLTARAGVEISGFSITLAMLLIVLSSIYYISLDKLFGILMLILLVLAYPLAVNIAALPMWSWLGASIGIFVVGWVFQFVGHYFEKKKPAFVDDVIGLAIGPLFVLAEFVFLLGFRKPLHQRILKEAQMKRAEMDMKPQTVS
ncbi:Mpo1 family 2-hydroxy fatty acid dioxygenase [Acinetobacter gyllenbergii]|uniref:Mpo1 family 2-hydroxy fatty acid dioxygenase n=1 Tax=Acinetobacter gyllenbergii TaxID=134534 RepID=UPI000806EE61|nr:Mpo1-like protein [Acinetobacter gyllenbergii]OBY74632.1 membrane protein [Acinetobacter gyllenbergii]